MGGRLLQSCVAPHVQFLSSLLEADEALLTHGFLHRSSKTPHPAHTAPNGPPSSPPFTFSRRTVRILTAGFLALPPQTETPMKKLSLHPDELKVETFDPTAASAEPLGTVHGAGGTVGACCTYSCRGTCGADLSNKRQDAATVTNCP